MKEAIWMDVLPINLSRKTSEIVIDPTVFKDGDCKKIRVWSWKRFKTIKYVVCYKDGEFSISKFD